MFSAFPCANMWLKVCFCSILLPSYYFCRLFQNDIFLTYTTLLSVGLSSNICISLYSLFKSTTESSPLSSLRVIRWPRNEKWGWAILRTITLVSFQCCFNIISIPRICALLAAIFVRYMYKLTLSKFDSGQLKGRGWALCRKDSVLIKIYSWSRTDNKLCYLCAL